MDNTLQRKQFINLFTVELWERFAFYTLNSLFVLFAISTYFSQKSAYLIFGIFMALAYGLPTVGGMLADRWIGIKRTLIVGATVLMLGYLVLAFAHSYTTTLVALAIVAVGNALFKPNPSSLIGLIYRENAAATNAAFTLYYMAINVGSLIATVCSPLIAKHTNFKITFLVACVGMLFALGNFVLRYRLFQEVHNVVGSKPLKSKNAMGAVLVIIAMLVVSYLMLNFNNIAFYIVLVLTIICYGYLAMGAIGYSDKNDKIKQLIFLWVEFPAACRDHMKDERIYTQKPQRDGTALPFGISSKVPSVDI